MSWQQKESEQTMGVDRCEGKEKRRLLHIITAEEEGACVGDILRQNMGLSTAHVRRIKWREDGILLEGQRVSTRITAKEGQTLSALLEEGGTSRFIAIEGALDVVYEDADFLVVNKEAGVVVHPTPNHWNDTLGNFLLHYYGQTQQEIDFHPVHRLDRGTSGLIVVAKHPYAQDQFTKQLHSPMFSREYVALCWGDMIPKVGTIDAPIYQEEKMRRCVDSRGVQAITHYQTIATGQREGKPVSLVALKLATGRTHQIRVHLTNQGYPLIGDELYGAGDLLIHTALHAFRLSLHHPVSNNTHTFYAPLPEDVSTLFAEANLEIPNWHEIHWEHLEQSGTGEY